MSDVSIDRGICSEYGKNAFHFRCSHSTPNLWGKTLQKQTKKSLNLDKSEGKCPVPLSEIRAYGLIKSLIKGSSNG